MNTLRVAAYMLKYVWYLLAGGVALLLIYFYDGGLALKYIYATGHSRWTVNLSMLDWYYLFNLCLILPFVRGVMKRAYRKDSVEFETYKDKALRLHHSDAQANHKGRSWSANGVTVNPWEYQYSQTQSYKGAADFSFNVAKNLFLNILIIIFGPLFLVYVVIRKFRQRKNL